MASHMEGLRANEQWFEKMISMTTRRGLIPTNAGVYTVVKHDGMKKMQADTQEIYDAVQCSDEWKEKNMVLPHPAQAAEQGGAPPMAPGAGLVEEEETFRFVRSSEGGRLRESDTLPHPPSGRDQIFVTNDTVLRGDDILGPCECCGRSIAKQRADGFQFKLDGTNYVVCNLCPTSEAACKLRRPSSSGSAAPAHRHVCDFCHAHENRGPDGALSEHEMDLWSDTDQRRICDTCFCDVALKKGAAVCSSLLSNYCDICMKVQKDKTDDTGFKVRKTGGGGCDRVVSARACEKCDTRLVQPTKEDYRRDVHRIEESQERMRSAFDEMTLLQQSQFEKFMQEKAEMKKTMRRMEVKASASDDAVSAAGMLAENRIKHLQERNAALRQENTDMKAAVQTNPVRVRKTSVRDPPEPAVNKSRAIQLKKKKAELKKKKAELQNAHIKHQKKLRQQVARLEAQVHELSSSS